MKLLFAIVTTILVVFILLSWIPWLSWGVYATFTDFNLEWWELLPSLLYVLLFLFLPVSVIASWVVAIKKSPGKIWNILAYISILPYLLVIWMVFLPTMFAETMAYIGIAVVIPGLIILWWLRKKRLKA